MKPTAIRIIAQESLFKMSKLIGEIVRLEDIIFSDVLPKGIYDHLRTIIKNDKDSLSHYSRTFRIKLDALNETGTPLFKIKKIKV